MRDRVNDSLSEALMSLLARRRELDLGIARLRAAAQRLATLLPRRRRAVASVNEARKARDRR